MQLIYTGSAYLNADFFASFYVEEEQIKGKTKDGEHETIFVCGDESEATMVFYTMALEISASEAIVDLIDIQDSVNQYA